MRRGDKVLVTGASGFTGSHLVRRLCEQGCDVRAIIRNSSKRDAIADLPIEYYVGDVYDHEIINAAIESVDYVFHVAAAYRSGGIDDDVYRKVHVDSTRMLAEAAIQLAPQLKRFVHFSTIGVHGHIDAPPANESAPFKPGDIYQQTKLEGEQWIANYAKQQRLPLTVIRPAAIYGPGDERLLKLFRFAKLPIVPLIGSSQGLYHLIHVEDLVSFALSAATSKEALFEVYICGNQHPTSIREIVSTVADNLGRRPRYIRLPAPPFFMLARACEVVFKSIGLEPPIYPRRVAFFTKDRAFDTSKMRSLNGFRPRYDNRTGLIETARRYQEMGLL